MSYQRHISADVAQHHALETDKVWFDSWTAQRNYIEVCDACSREGGEHVYHSHLDFRREKRAPAVRSAALNKISHRCFNRQLKDCGNHPGRRWPQEGGSWRTGIENQRGGFFPPASGERVVGFRGLQIQVRFSPSCKYIWG